MTTKRKTTALKQLEILNKRGFLSQENLLELKRLRTGYEGETYFISYLKKHITSEPIIINDFRFSVKKSECQIDCLLIYQNKCIILEIKNYRTDFYVDNTQWFIANNKKQIRSPIEQMNNGKRMLAELFNEEGIRMKIDGYVVFINSQFLLYNAPFMSEIVFPNRLKNFVNDLNRQQDYLSDWHNSIYEKIKSRHIDVSTHETPIDFDVDSLTNGVTCFIENCKGFMQVKGRKYVICKSCGSIETMDQAIIRSVKDRRILFPKDKITVSSISEWMGNTISVEKIRKTLSANCVCHGRGKNTYYELVE